MSSHPAARSHDLLPLPLGAALEAASHELTHATWLKEAVKSINEMGGRGALRGSERTSLSQRLALAGLARDFACIPECPTDVTVKSSLEQVLGHGPGYVNDLACGHRSEHETMPDGVTDERRYAQRVRLRQFGHPCLTIATANVQMLFPRETAGALLALASKPSRIRIAAMNE